MSIEDWWTQDVSLQSKERRRTWAAINMYTAWNLWKERNRRTFEAKAAEPGTILHLIKEEVNLCFQACGKPEVV